MMFRVRVDSQRNDQGFLDFLQQYKSYVCVFHELPHGNPHYHMFIEDTMSLSIDALRKRVDRNFNVKGADRSVKECDASRVNEYIQYLYNQKHGNVSTHIGHRNIDDSLLLQLQTQAKDVADDFAHRKKVKQSKQQVSQYDLAEEVRSRLSELHKLTFTIEDYTKVAIQVMRKHRKAFCKYSLGRIIMTAMDDEKIVAQMQNYFHEL